MALKGKHGGSTDPLLSRPDRTLMEHVAPLLSFVQNVLLTLHCFVSSDAFSWPFGSVAESPNHRRAVDREGNEWDAFATDADAPFVL